MNANCADDLTFTFSCDDAGTWTVSGPVAWVGTLDECLDFVKGYALGVEADPDRMSV